jgi:hypothetical protein
MVILDAVSKGFPFGEQDARPDGGGGARATQHFDAASETWQGCPNDKAPHESRFERAGAFGTGLTSRFRLAPNTGAAYDLVLIEMNTVRRPLVLLTLATTLILAAGMAHAATCYVLFDRFDNVVYRNTVSPIDMSDQGAAARAALRERGEYLMVMDSDRCVPVTFVFGAAGSKTLSLDETVGGFPPENPPQTRASPKVRRSPSAAPATAPDRSTPPASK